MIITILRKLLLMVITLLILSFISFHILLRDPFNAVEMKMDASHYLAYVTQLLQGNFGVSYLTGESLTSQLLSVLPATISLCLSASLLSLVVGLPMGFFAAYKRTKWIGKLLSVLGSFSLVIPVFWLALVLLYLGAVNQWQISSVGELNPIYEITAVTGIRLIDIFLSEAPYKLKMIQSALHHLVLPTLILSIPAILEVMRLTQKRAEYVLKQQYVKMAQARGWSLFKILRVYVFRNTVAPIIPMIAHNVTLIFAFSMLIENIFGWGGIGRWMINALANQDYNTISAGVVAIGLFVLLIDMLSTLITLILDPNRQKGWYDA